MCIVSMIGDGWRPSAPSWPTITPVRPEPSFIPTFIQGISQSEFDALKREVEELKKLLIAARKFDEATGQKDCQMEDKIRFLKEMAKQLGVDFSDVFEEPLIRN